MIRKSFPSLQGCKKRDDANGRKIKELKANNEKRESGRFHDGDATIMLFDAKTNLRLLILFSISFSSLWSKIII